MNPLDLFWIFLVLASLQPVISQRLLFAMRQRKIAEIEKRRGSRVILLVHRQETMRLLGFPLMRYIDINDSEEVMRAIQLTGPDVPVDLVLHTPGGLVLAALQIARALKLRGAGTTVFVPHLAMSGGTLIALAADEIIMEEHAVLGPVDPQLGHYPAAALVKVTEIKDIDEISDETLIMADMAAKSRKQVTAFVTNLMQPRLSEQRATEVATILSDGRFTHDFPIMAGMARELGLPISTEMPEAMYELMDLYPQQGSGRPSIIYLERRANDESR